MTSRGFWIDHFPGNFLWSNAALACKGMAPYGVVAMDEIDRIALRLKDRQEEPEAWPEEWCAMAAKLENTADAAAAKGQERSAGNTYLRAGNYYYTGERFIPPGEAKAAVGRKAYRCFREGLTRRHPEIEFVEVPYLQATLPALFMKAPGVSVRAPTVVIFNGMDNCKEMSVIFAGLEFAKRGMHTLAIDGPGQGETLRFRGIPSRFDYEVPGKAAYDYVAQRADVAAGAEQSHRSIGFAADELAGDQGHFSRFGHGVSGFNRRHQATGFDHAEGDALNGRSHGVAARRGGWTVGTGAAAGTGWGGTGATGRAGGTAATGLGGSLGSCLGRRFRSGFSHCSRFGRRCRQGLGGRCRRG